MKTKWFYRINIILPLISGVLVYLYWRPDTYISAFIWNISGVSPPQPQGKPTGIQIIIRYYLCDALWAYALIFSLAAFIGIDDIRLICIIGACFSIFMESMQLLPQFPGSFDVIDILVEIIICILATYIIKKHETTRRVL